MSDAFFKALTEWSEDLYKADTVVALEMLTGVDDDDTSAVLEIVRSHLFQTAFDEQGDLRPDTGLGWARLPGEETPRIVLSVDDLLTMLGGQVLVGMVLGVLTNRHRMEASVGP